jgi:fructose-1-phosphate kinase PfkB-like protein
VCRVLGQLGERALHLTQLGGALRPLLLELAAKDDVAVEWVESGSDIRFCHTLINNADGSVTELVEESEPVAPGTEARVRAAYTKLLDHHDTVIISGTRAPGFSPELFPHMTALAKEAGRRVILDLRGDDLVNSLRYRPDLVKPNQFEFAQTFAPELILHNRLIGDRERVKERVRATALDRWARYQSKIVITRGTDTVWLCDEAGFWELAVQAVPPVNTTGSGDAFTAGLASALAEGASLGEAAQEGARCGALNAALLGLGRIR